MKKYLLLLLMLAMALTITTGCDQPRHPYQKHTKQQVHVYKQHGTNYMALQAEKSDRPKNKTDDDWIYWYVVYYNHGVFYASSASYVSPSQYDTLGWVQTSSPTVILSSLEPLESVATETVDNAALGTQTDATIEAAETQAQVDAMVNEGNPNTGETTSESSTESGGESGSDMGGGDSGGGDSGGGGGGD